VPRNPPLASAHAVPRAGRRMSHPCTHPGACSPSVLQAARTFQAVRLLLGGIHMKKFLKTQLTVAAVLAGALALGTGCKSDQSATRGTEPTPASDSTMPTDSSGTGTD